MLGRGGPPGPIAMGWAAALAPWASGVVSAAAAGRPGTGSAAGSMAVALAAASHPSCHQPCPAPKLHTEVTHHHPGLRAWRRAEGHPLGAPQGPRPGGSAPQRPPRTPRGPGSRQNEGWGPWGAEAQADRCQEEGAIQVQGQAAIAGGPRARAHSWGEGTGLRAGGCYATSQPGHWWEAEARTAPRIIARIRGDQAQKEQEGKGHRHGHGRGSTCRGEVASGTSAISFHPAL